ncbi:MAG: Stk1 family PASTA domain-containing Ser/Thr kinase, partial [Lachnospiraceae bacterium]|nr:Stk1 family PASTA domain-containing Ser/Thr kinase [Lachnospiraceae bacterium]
MEQSVLDHRYELLKHIGGGGMADVYKAHDSVLDRLVAVKILHAQLAGDEDFLEKFHLEAKGAARLSHPNIVGIFDVGRDGDKHYIVMEYIAGETLKKKIQREGKLSVEEALRIAKEIARALREAHKNNLVHCDIKPHNILVTPDGRVKVADFGIARAVTSSTMTYNGNVIGSVHYFSPEQAKGTKITPKSDVYSLGIVLYEMLTGVLPFTGETTVSIALKHLQEEARPVCQHDRTLPPMVEAIVQKAMAKDPADRPNSDEMIEDLQQAERFLGFEGGHDVGEADPFATRLMQPVDVELLPEADTEEESGTSKPFFKSKIFMAAAIFLVFLGFAAGAFFAFGKFWSMAEVQVPDVKARPMAFAKQLLETAKLRVNIVEQYDAQVSAGQVITQSPDAGAMVKEQRVVTIYVSKGGEELTMPNLKGLSRLSAENKLKKMNLTVGNIYEKVSDQEAWTVLEQEPAEGKKIQKGQSVDLTISKGKPIKLVRVPDFSGGTLDAAKDRLKQLRLSVGTVTGEQSRQAAGTILRQTPSAGTEVDEETTVDFVIAESTKSSTPSTPEKKDG